MADITDYVNIDGLPPADNIFGAEMMEVLQAGVNRRATAEQVLQPLRDDLDDPDKGSYLVAFKWPNNGSKERSVSDKLMEVALSSGDYIDLKSAIDASIQENTSVSLYRDTTIKIPTDCPSLQAAVDHISPAYKSVRVNLLIESGYSPDSGLNLQDADYSWVTVSSEEEVVSLSDGFTGRFINVVNGTGPTLGCYVSAGNSNLDRIYSIQGGFGYIKPGCGGEGAKGRPLYGNSSFIQAPNTVWKNGGDSIYFSAGSGAQLGGALVEGFTVTANGSLVASRGAKVEAQGIKIKNCARGFEVKRAGSSINAHGGLAENISGFVVRVSRAGSASLSSAVITGCGASAIECYGGSVSIGEGAVISASSGNAANSCGITVNGAGSVDASNSTITGFSRFGVWASDSASVSIASAVITSSGSHGVYSEQVSRINANGCTITQSGGNDLRVASGGEINAFSAKTTNSTGSSPNLSDTNVNGFGGFNAVASGGRGIIWAN